jgi:hypothetical protein
LKPEHGTGKCEASRYYRQDEADGLIASEFVKRLVVLRRALATVPRQREQPDFEGKRRALAQQRKNVVDAIAAGVLSLSDAKDKLGEIDDNLATLNAAEMEFDASVAHDTPDARSAAKAYVQQIEIEWSTWTADIRREFLKAFAQKIVFEGPKPSVHWRDSGEIASLHHQNRMPPIYRPSVDDDIPALPPPRRSAKQELLEGARSAEPIAARRR